MARIKWGPLISSLTLQGSLWPMLAPLTGRSGNILTFGTPEGHQTPQSWKLLILAEPVSGPGTEGLIA